MADDRTPQEREDALAAAAALSVRGGMRGGPITAEEIAKGREIAREYVAHEQASPRHAADTPEAGAG